MTSLSRLDGFYEPSKLSRTEKRSIDIEDLLHWVYAKQLVGNAGVFFRDGPGGAHISGDGCAAVEWFGQLGMVVDRSRPSGAYDVHPDAEAVHAVLTGHRDGRPQGTAALIARHARAATRPDWWDGPTTWFEPVWRNGERGRIVGGRIEAGRIEQVYPYKGAPRPVACPVRGFDRRAEAEARRRIYADWHAGVSGLLDRLPALRAHEVTGFAAPAKPWEKRRLTDICGNRLTRFPNG